MPKLNLGSGTDIRAGWVNLDSAKLPGVDVVHDIQKLPLPFKDGEFDIILCRDILQHVDYTPILKDLYRILRPGGKLIIRVPHFTSKNNVIDPTHRSTFSVRTFDFFV
ncbi:class I SAM-dependent methyltransferase, partial [Candidatus Parcubacteria bacterium]|nr:class I SAM-dependent methyltransferase [Candidatus Parcubacteria bacterium]